MLSMTGYGKGEARQEDLTVTVEVRTVNHRYADIAVKLPRSFMVLENKIRKQVGRTLQRGKIDVFVNYELAAGARTEPVLNHELAAAYHALLEGLQNELGLAGRLSVEFLASQKGVVEIEEATLDNAVLEECLFRALAAALDQLVDMRRLEGEETAKDMTERLAVAEELLAQVEARAPQVPLEWQVKLSERLNRLNGELDFDPQRVAQEIAVFADRCDISEEIARFRSHLVQFRGLFDDKEAVGRRMDFLVQELNREVNTMGSKSNDADLTRCVVAMKSELEKVREQVQNIE
jgi:uncharacterized protein (TIGR00255 family)